MKPRRCKLRTCRAEFTPLRNGLNVQKYCNPACELDDAQTNPEPIGRIVKPKTKPKVKTAGALKKDLWAIFSLHQKIVHSNDGEWCNCYTCDKPIKIGDRDCHGGHCMSKSGNPNLFFDERAVRPQCLRCNVPLGGMHYEFNQKLKQEIGVTDWQDMYENRMQVNKRTRQWFEEKIEYYKAEVNRLKALKSVN